MGRHQKPDALKYLQGNPGKRKLLLDPAAKGTTPVVPVETPDFLTEERERAIFRRIVDDYVHRRIARNADIPAYGRWATYLHRWMAYKEQLDGKATFYQIESNHGKRMARVPMFADMLDLERALLALEDRIGLNPLARQNILRGLSALPPTLTGEDPKESEAEGEPKDKKPAAEVLPSPIGLGRLN